jgi:hypothetical protein
VDRTDWIEHRRGDGELIGWMRPESDAFVPVDLLGRDLAGPLDWLHAEELLEQTGLSYLAEPYELHIDGGVERVRILEVSPARIRVKQDDGGAVGGPLPVVYDLGWPIPAELRLRAR